MLTKRLNKKFGNEKFNRSSNSKPKKITYIPLKYFDKSKHNQAWSRYCYYRNNFTNNKNKVLIYGPNNQDDVNDFFRWKAANFSN
tara:strand:- start:117 stop:371 length:255 start_codon:yes stop_codon:yes gene_type:complete